MRKVYDIIIRKNKKNISLISKASCCEAIQALEEKVDPSLEMFDSQEYRFKPNSIKLMRELAEQAEDIHGVQISINEWYWSKRDKKWF